MALRVSDSCKPEESPPGFRRLGFFDTEEFGNHLPRLLAQRQPLIEKLAVALGLAYIARTVANRRVNRVTQGLLEITDG